MLHLLRYLRKKDYMILLLSFGLIILQVYLELKMPDYTKNLTTLVSTQSTDMGAVWENGAYMLACALGSMLSAFACSYLISKMASHFSMTLRNELFGRIMSFSNREMNDFSTPSLITRTTNDVVQVQNFMAMGVQLLLKAPITAVWALIKISATNDKWTMSMGICIGIIVVFVLLMITLCLPKFKRIQKLTDELNDVTRENIAGVRVIRAFNAEQYQEKKFDDVNRQITGVNLFTGRAMGLMMPVLTICMNGLTLAIYWIGAIIINDITVDMGSMEIAMASITERGEVIANMAAFTSYALQVVMAFMMLVMIFIMAPRTMVAGNRIYEVINTRPEIKDGKGVETKEKGTIEFKNVSFAYSKDGHNTLEDVSFRIEKGQTVAIIGATGSGKTTIVNLIPRFYDATEGQILVDGVDVKEYVQSDLRRKIAVASQKALLFTGSIRDNIVYGSDEIDEDRLRLSVDISKSDFVAELEDGLDSKVAQGGNNFSGGQKQRISIARALYKDAEIMIFDDTFSALDYKTDMLVRKGIRESFSEKTFIIIAQRIGTIRNADTIIVLDEGRIVGKGSHEELLNNCMVYKEIALSQLSEEEL